MLFNQNEYQVRCEWGLEGVNELTPISDVVIIVDVLSFSTSVEVAVSRGGIVWPYRWKDQGAALFAQEVGAELAGHRGTSTYSLSPASLSTLPAETAIVLPSPNGSTLTFAAGEYDAVVLVGCLRNAEAVARAATLLGQTIAVIPAGERWPDNRLRPAIEDLIGAGAIIGAIDGWESRSSPEAEVAVAAFRAVEGDLHNYLRGCGSGKELIERGFDKDVLLAAEHDISQCVPILREGKLERSMNDECRIMKEDRRI